MCSQDIDEPGCPFLVMWPVGLTLYSQKLCNLHIHSPYINNNSENLQNACNSRDEHLNTKLSVLKKRNLKFVNTRLEALLRDLCPYWPDDITPAEMMESPVPPHPKGVQNKCWGLLNTTDLKSITWPDAQLTESPVTTLTAWFLTTFWTSLSLEWFTIPSILSPWGSFPQYTPTNNHIVNFWMFKLPLFH